MVVVVLIARPSSLLCWPDLADTGFAGDAFDEAAAQAAVWALPLREGATTRALCRSPKDLGRERSIAPASAAVYDRKQRYKVGSIHNHLQRKESALDGREASRSRSPGGILRKYPKRHHRQRDADGQARNHLRGDLQRLAMILTHATSLFGLLHPIASSVSQGGSPE